MNSEKPKQFNVSVEKGIQTLKILEGKAEEPIGNPKPCKISGVLSAPRAFLEKRSDIIDQNKCHLIVDRTEGSFVLNINEKNPIKDTVYGDLKLNPEYEEWGINTTKQRSPIDLANFARMRLHHFTEKSTGMTLVSELKNFRAKVHKDIERSENDRGNKKTLHEQIVDSNVPEGFQLNVPVFKGAPSRRFAVEIIVSPELNVSLFSPEVNDIINDVKEKEIDKELDAIKKLAPNIAIIEA